MLDIEPKFGKADLYNIWKCCHLQVWWWNAASVFVFSTLEFLFCWSQMPNRPIYKLDLVWVLADVLGVNRHEHINQPLRQQESNTQQHQNLQSRRSFGPNIRQQQPELPPKTLPGRWHRRGGRRRLLHLGGWTESQVVILLSLVSGGEITSWWQKNEKKISRCSNLEATAV